MANMFLVMPSTVTGLGYTAFSLNQSCSLFTSSRLFRDYEAAQKRAKEEARAQ